MKIALALAASLMATAALAQSTTVIQRDTAPSTTVIEKRDNPVVIERRSTTESTGSVGCDTTVQKKTDAVGDTTVKRTTEC